MPEDKSQEDIDSDVFERLNTIEDFARLSPAQKQILFAHVKDPYLSKDQIARNLGVSKATVYRMFYSEKFGNINEELARQEKAEILQLAITTLRDCMKSKNDGVRFAAACRVLSDAGVLKGEPKTIKQDNKIVIAWKSGEPLGEMNAIHNIALPASSQTIRDT